MTRYYKRVEIDDLCKRGRIQKTRDRNDNQVYTLTITLPEPGGQKIHEEVRALEDVTLQELLNNRYNPYLREMARTFLTPNTQTGSSK